MERRTFIQSSVAGLCVAATSASSDAADAKPAGEFYELRTYTLKPDKQAALEAYFAKALIPAVKKAGAGPVGVFVESPNPKAAADTVRIQVLIVHPSADSPLALPGRLAADEDYKKAAADHLAARAADPPYTRIESSILSAIAGMPKLEKPDVGKPRLLNLRIYESHNDRAAAKKIEMFEKGELAIFRRVGLTPVLFAGAVAGAQMPNLTYLLAFPDDAARTAAWDRFRVDPEWLKLRAMPEYADKEIVSRITNLLMTPAACSEI